MTSKCGKDKKVAHKPSERALLMFLKQFDVLCDLEWNL